MKKRGPKPSKYKVAFWEQLPKSTQKPIGAILEDIDTTIKEAFAARRRRDGSEVEVLSGAVADVPTYLQGLGYYMADAENEMNLLKDDLELLEAQKEKALIAESKSVAEAVRTVAIDHKVKAARVEYRKAQHNYRVLRIKWDGTLRQLDGWRSRLSTIRPEVRGGV